MAEFADDLRRYLDHQPISARADSLGYRATKFVRRNRIAVALASIAVLALLAGSPARSPRRSARRARRASPKTSAAAPTSRRASRPSSATSHYASCRAPRRSTNSTSSCFPMPHRRASRSRPASSRARRSHRPAPARGLRRESDRHAGVDRPSVPVVDHENDALRLLTQAYDMARTQADPTTHARAACALASAISVGSGGDRAEALFREGISLLPDEPQYALDRIHCLSEGSLVAREAYHADESLLRVQQAQALLPQLRYRSAALELNVLMDLAESYRIAGQYGHAIATFEQAYARTLELGRENTESAGTLYNNWALALASPANSCRPRPCTGARSHQQRRRHGQERLADGAQQPCGDADRLGRIDEAQRYADEAYDRARADGDEVIARYALGARARVFRVRGQYAQGTQALTELEQQFHRAYPPECSCFGTIASERGLLAAAHGDGDRAMAEMDKAIAIAEGDKSRPDALPRILVRRAEVELALGQPAAAQQTPSGPSRERQGHATGCALGHRRPRVSGRGSSPARLGPVAGCRARALIRGRAPPADARRRPSADTPRRAAGGQAVAEKALLTGARDARVMPAAPGADRPPR